MNGDGLFLNESISDFTLASNHDTSFLQLNTTNVLRVQKPQNQSVSFSSGLVHTFSSSSIKHISFQFASTDPDTEDSNLRIMDSSSGETLVLFRAGKGGLIRVNQKQMVSFYNDSVSTDSSIKLIKVDLVVDWTNKEIQIFVDDTYKTKSIFFSQQVDKVDKLLIYNLYQSVSYWSNIVVCSDICYDFNSSNIHFFTYLTLIILFIHLY